MSLIVIVSGNSGSGKSTIVNNSISSSKNLTMNRIITCTTREQRASEVDGVDYRFFSEDEFLLKLKNNCFAEHENVYGNYYGVLHSDVNHSVEKFDASIIISDVKGSLYLKDVFSKRFNILSFFITINDKEILKERLIKRKEKKINERLLKYESEREFMNKFDIVINNVKLLDSCREFIENINLKNKKYI